ncbi:nephrin isoform X1 [Vespula squamosa]|uniref:Nephrin isoform X1 n=1 Tax=Vespula squamosa TaxID=30214 RepID=A0ABD2A0R7_VESSQ
MPGFLKSKDAQQASAGNPVPLVNISVVEGKPAELPCDITPPGEDTLHMVFWFKDEAGVPLYTRRQHRCHCRRQSCNVRESSKSWNVIGRDRARLAPCASSETRSSGDLGDSSLDYGGVEAGQGSCPSLVSSGKPYEPPCSDIPGKNT